MDQGEAPRGFRQRLARLRPWRAPSVWICLGLAVMLVAAAVPRRQVASRIATEARIPMRALTPPEAAVLLAAGRARLARLDAETVDLVTRDYLIPLAPGDRRFEGALTHGGRSWRRLDAGWNGYSLRHELARGPLERELAGRPLAAFLDPAAAAERISFDSRLLGFYAVFEVALLWTTFLLLWSIVRRVRPLHLVPPALLLLVCGYLVAVGFYAPAHFDADAFYQRWVVEEGFYYLIPLATALVPVAAFSLLGLLAVAFVRSAQERPPGPRQRMAASWAPAALFALIVAGAHVVSWLRPGGAADNLVMNSRMFFQMIFWWW